MTMRSHDELLDLMLLGLTWVQEETGSLTGRTGNGVLQTMRAAGALSDRQYHQLAAGDSAFRAFLFPVTHLEFGRQISQRVIRRTSTTTEKLMLAMVNAAMYSGEKLFTPRGYKMVATEAGQRRALRVAPSYASVVTRRNFWDEWVRHSKQMRGMHAALREN